MSQFFRPPAKYDFYLDGIDPVAIERKYNLTTLSNIERSTPSHKTSSIKSLYFDQSRLISYVDTTRRNRNWVLTMRDHLTQQELPLKWEGCCCACHLEIRSRPLGCPLRYIPSELIHTFTSEFSKGPISQVKKLSRREIMKYKYDPPGPEYRLVERDYYETIHVFCSFNCIVKHIEDNRHLTLYKDSMKEVFNLYFDFFAERITRIPAAPSFLLRKKYGGELSDEDFRKSFKNLIFVDAGAVCRKLPVMYPIGMAFEKLVTF